MATRDDVKAKVIRLLSVVSSMDESKVRDNEELKLGGDLLLSLAMIKALAVPYTRISGEFGGGRVTMAEAAGCKTVGDVIKLICDKLPKGTK